MEYSNQQLINGIKQGDVVAFEELYRRYYIFLCLIAEHIVRNSSDAEEIVSDVFVKIWNIRDKIEITSSIKAYPVSYTHLRAHETRHDLVCRLLLEKKKKTS